jgi:ankyrin repeat protein
MKKFILIAALLLPGINLKAQSLNDQLYSAIARKDTLMVEKLLDKGADANYIKKWDKSEMTLLIFSVNYGADFKIVKLLVEHKADVNKKDVFNITALMYAASEGYINIIKYLLDHGADVHANDGQGDTVLSLAILGAHPEAIRLIEDRLNKH